VLKNKDFKSNCYKKKGDGKRLRLEILCKLSSLVPVTVPWLAGVQCGLGAPPASAKLVNWSYTHFNVETSETLALGCRQIHVVGTEPIMCLAQSSVFRSGCTFSKQKCLWGFFEGRFLIAFRYTLSKRLGFLQSLILGPGERMLNRVKDSACETVDKMFIALYGNLLTHGISPASHVCLVRAFT